MSKNRSKSYAVKRALGRERLGILGRIEAYHLTTNVYALGLLIGLTLVSVYLYSRSANDSGFSSNLWLAFATSLMASVLVMASETFVKFRSHENDVFLEGIAKLGISNLHFDKRALLSDLLDGCRAEFWGVGYRHILSRQLVDQIERAVNRGAQVRFLIVPSWTTSFQLVFGDNERVCDNYVQLFNAIVRGASGYSEKSGGDIPGVRVRFIDKPVFNDTYRVDDAVVTGPYMHNTDPVHGVITANDFFTYELHRSSHLHGLIIDEFETLWDSAEHELDWARYRESARVIATTDLNESAKAAEIQRACTRLSRD